LLDTCVQIAIAAAERGMPVQMQRKLEHWQVAEIESAVGYRPTDRDIKAELNRAVNLQRLRYVKGHGKQKAGYFPFEVDPQMLALDPEWEIARRRKHATAEAKN
jgi:hypothetical protein